MLLHVHQWKNETLELYGETPVRQFTVQHECWGNKRDWDQCQGWWHRRIALHCLSITSESEKGKMIFDSWESSEGYYNASFEGESQCFSRVLGQSDKCKKISYSEDEHFQPCVQYLLITTPAWEEQSCFFMILVRYSKNILPMHLLILWEMKNHRKLFKVMHYTEIFKVI